MEVRQLQLPAWIPAFFYLLASVLLVGVLVVGSGVVLAEVDSRGNQREAQDPPPGYWGFVEIPPVARASQSILRRGAPGAILRGGAPGAISVPGLSHLSNRGMMSNLPQVQEGLLPEEEAHSLSLPGEGCAQHCERRGLRCAGASAVEQCGVTTDFQGCGNSDSWILRQPPFHRSYCTADWHSNGACGNNPNIYNSYCCRCAP